MRRSSLLLPRRRFGTVVEKAKEVISETKETVKEKVQTALHGEPAELTIAEQTAERAKEIAEMRLDEAKAGAAAVRSWVQNYRDALEHSPLRANAVTSGVLCAVGDVLAQTIERRHASVGSAERERPLDKLRMARMATYGTLVCGPLLSGWYKALHNVGEAVSVSYTPVVGGWLGRLPILSSLQVEAEAALSPLRLLLAKVFADSILFQAPLLNLYFATMGALEGLSPSEIYARAKEKFHRAWALSIVVWSPVQFLNFCYVPPPLQPALVAAVNVGWQATLSILNASHAEAAVVVDAQDAELALLRSELDRLALENDALRGEVEAARQRRWWWPWR